MNVPASQNLRSLPSVSKCLQSARGKELQQRFGAGITTLAVRDAIESARIAIQSGSESSSPSIDAVMTAAANELARIATPLGRRAINATGILLHTGLGRAPLSRSALEALAGFGHYSLLEVELESGERGRRESRVEELLCVLTGCEAAVVVNNNAAATFMVLRSVARGKEVIVSRGQLIEIGGSFRLPDVMSESGCCLHEVGTTNRTHLRDYREAIGPHTGAIIHVHTSNYRIHGFTDTPGIAELVALGKEHGVPVIDDLGSGAFVPLAEFGLTDELLVKDSLACGSSLVCFSGDKLICGPQAGIICGTKEAVERLRRDTFFRMFRPDKMTLAALEATLIHFVNGDEYKREIPLYQMLSQPLHALQATAEALQSGLTGVGTVRTAVEDGQAYTGGGALPDEALPSKVLRVSSSAGGSWAQAAAKKLRLGIPSVFCRIHEGSLLFDMRTLLPEDADLLAEALKVALA
ncbi:MAG: L-seryl-tRNA(Sec) selenium transferase [Bdellovibrionota bacterium]